MKGFSISLIKLLFQNQSSMFTNSSSTLRLDFLFSSFVCSLPSSPRLSLLVLSLSSDSFSNFTVFRFGSGFSLRHTGHL